MCVLWDDKPWRTLKSNLYAYKVVQANYTSAVPLYNRTPQHSREQGVGKVVTYEIGKLMVAEDPGYYLYTKLEDALLEARSPLWPVLWPMKILRVRIPKGTMLRRGWAPGYCRAITALQIVPVQEMVPPHVR